MYAFSYPAGDARSVPNIRHLNPAVTTVLFITGRFGIGRTFLYLLAQVRTFCERVYARVALPSSSIVLTLSLIVFR